MLVVTGIFLAEAASTILRDDHKLSGGVYTPACLGESFISRLEPHGIKFERRFYEEWRQNRGMEQEYALA